MNDEYATLRAAEAAGARIQARHLTDAYPVGEWVTLPNKALFNCPVHLYRIHPEDVS